MLLDPVRKQQPFQNSNILPVRQYNYKTFVSRIKEQLSPKIAESPLAAAAINGALSWCFGFLLDARRTALRFDTGMRDNAWRTSRMSPPSMASSRARCGALWSIWASWSFSVFMFLAFKTPCKIRPPPKRFSGHGGNGGKEVSMGECPFQLTTNKV